MTIDPVSIALTPASAPPAKPAFGSQGIFSEGFSDAFASALAEERGTAPQIYAKSAATQPAQPFGISDRFPLDAPAPQAPDAPPPPKGPLPDANLVAKTVIPDNDPSANLNPQPVAPDEGPMVAPPWLNSEAGAAHTAPLSTYMGPNGEPGFPVDGAPDGAHTWIMPDGRAAAWLPGSAPDPSLSRELDAKIRDTYAVQKDGLYGTQMNPGGAFTAFPPSGHAGFVPGLTAGMLDYALRAVANGRSYSYQSEQYVGADGQTNTHFTLRDAGGKPMVDLTKDVLGYLKGKGLIDEAGYQTGLEGMYGLSDVGAGDLNKVPGGDLTLILPPS